MLPTATPAGDQPKYGGVLRIGQWIATGNVGTKIFVADPFKGGAFGSSANLKLFNRLMQRNPYDNQNLTGDLAASWEVTNDGSVYTLKLVQGAEWHDAQPIVAGDVVYTFGLLFDPPEGRISISGRGFRGIIKDVQAIDDLTVRFTLNRPSASFLLSLSQWTQFIYPSHLPLQVVDEGGIGSGPFRLKSVTIDVKTELVRNDNYFKKDPQGRALPFLDGQELFSIADPGSVFANFRTGEIKFLNVHQTPTIESQQELLAREIPGIQFDEFVQGHFGVSFVNKPPFDDPRVREAISLWLDRKEMVDVGYNGVGSFYDAGLIPQELGGRWGLPPAEIMSVPGYRYVDADGNLIDSLEKLAAKRDEMVKDPADRIRAMELLEEAGIRPGDIKVEVITSGFEGIRGGPVFITQMASLFGAIWTIAPEPNSGILQQKKREGNFTVIFDAFTGYSLDDPSWATVRGRWTSVNPDTLGMGFDTSEIDALYNAQEAELDPIKRRDLIWDLQRAMLRNTMGIVTNDAVGVGGAWPEVRDVPNALAAQGNTFDLERVWLDN